jgi:uncharacterized membrane protein
VTRLERLIGVVLRAGVAVSSVCMSAGLLLSLAGVGRAASALMQIGILVLLATPAARVAVSVVEYAIERDWRFATLTVIVLGELIASAVAALMFNKRL